MNKNLDLRYITYGNFTLQEFANSKSQNSIKIDLDLVFKLQKLRDIVGPITVTSGYRDPEFNASVGGSSNSYHLKGLASDIRFDFKGWTKSALTKTLQSIGFTNVNFYWRGNVLDRIHVDIGKTWNGEDFNYRDLKA